MFSAATIAVLLLIATLGHAMALLLVHRAQAKMEDLRAHDLRAADQ